MILDYKSFTFNNKSIFEKVKMKPPFQPPSNFPNEAFFVYVLEGQQETYTPTEKIRLQQKDAILLKCGNYFTEWIEQSDYTFCEAIGIHLYPDVLKLIYEKETPNFILNKTTNSKQVSVVTNNQLIDAYIQSMLFYFENPNLVDDELIILKLKELILLLTKTEKANSIIEIVSKLFTPREHQLKEVVEAHLYSNVGLEVLASFCSLSLSTFKREFNKTYNEAPAKYLKRMKLEKSTELLKISDNSISDIANKCGFSDISHFSNSFKEHYNITPTEYRMTQK